jgi:DNA-binding response OmpR family regulator
MATILVCDDEPPLRELMRAAIGSDHRYLEAPDTATAREAMDYARPDLVLLDVMLPGENGIELLREIRRKPELESVPVVVVSAWADDEHRREAEDAGADAFLAKPFLPDELGALARQLLRRVLPQ